LEQPRALGAIRLFEQASTIQAAVESTQLPRVA